MVTYAYTGRVTDFGDAPFLDARPRVSVTTLDDVDAFTPNGAASRREIPVRLAGDGSFTVDLVASADLIPASRYVLNCAWSTTRTGDGQDIPSFWSRWEFTALIGGGPIFGMGNGVITNWWVSTSPPPVNRRGIYWLNPETGIVSEWSD